MIARSIGGSWIVGLAALLGLAGAGSAQGQVGRWLGQDGQDFCGARVEGVKPNGYQDVHILLGGLPPRREIAEVVIRGFGGGEWRSTVQNYAAIVVRRKPGAPTADLFLEPYQVETGRDFNIHLKFQDGSEASVDIRGGKADPDARMPELAMSARWVGQVKSDRAGASPGVGPDGLQDARIALAKLTPGTKVKAVVIEDRVKPRWAFGINHEGLNNAEFQADPKDPTRGEVDFQPDGDLAGKKLRVVVTYESGRKDSAFLTAARTDPKLAMPRLPLPRVSFVKVESRWLGQDGASGGQRGDVHIALSGLPSRRLVAVVLSDPIGGVWADRAAGADLGDAIEPEAQPMVVRAKGTSADLFFAPIRDESKATLTLRLIYAEGDSAVAKLPGGACDPARRGPELAKSEAVAKPGDDLAALVGRGGTIRLQRGEYRLGKPLVLTHPVAIVGDPGSVLLFDQAANEAPWTAAIKIHAGPTTLRGFAVRFAGPVRWKGDVAWGPAVIGTSDNFDNVPNGPKFGLAFENLDLEGPPSSGKTPWEETVKLFRSNGAVCGRIAGNVLKGGLIELFGGPWEVVDNDYRGTAAGTFTYSVLAFHDAHDVVIRGNKARSTIRGGKVWRFLALLGRGSLDRIEGNVVEGIGPRDDDTKQENAPEIVLTESYHLAFEGKPAAVSADGLLVRAGELRGLTPRTGDVVSVVAGTSPGQYRRIAQRIEPTVYLLDAPFPKGSEVLSISPGFVDELYAGNTIDARGGRGAACLILAGNHFGTKVLNNHFLGGGESFRLVAFPSETPNIWGWSHVPFFGAVVEGNTLEDSERGGLIAVDHGPAVKFNKGRVYMTATLRNNVVRWSDAYLSKLATTPARRPAAGLQLGMPGSFDPGELLVTESGDRLEAPARLASRAALRVDAATLNGRAIRNQSLTLQPGTSSATNSGAKRR